MNSEKQPMARENQDPGAPIITGSGPLNSTGASGSRTPTNANTARTGTTAKPVRQRAGTRIEEIAAAKAQRAHRDTHLRRRETAGLHQSRSAGR